MSSSERFHQAGIVVEDAQRDDLAAQPVDVGRVSAADADQRQQSRPDLSDHRAIDATAASLTRCNNTRTAAPRCRCPARALLNHKLGLQPVGSADHLPAYQKLAGMRGGDTIADEQVVALRRARRLPASLTQIDQRQFVLRRCRSRIIPAASEISRSVGGNAQLARTA